MQLLALWNVAEGDGLGGTGHLVGLARERGVTVRVLDTNTLFASSLDAA